MIKILITQAYLTLGKKIPSDPVEGNLFLDGWISALKSVPDASLKDSFSDALASGKPFAPGLVVQSWKEKTEDTRAELKRTARQDLNHPFPFHARLRETGSGRPYSFSLKQPAVCFDCGRDAEVFTYNGLRKPKTFFCSFHGENLSHVHDTR